MLFVHIWLFVVHAQHGDPPCALLSSPLQQPRECPRCLSSAQITICDSTRIRSRAKNQRHTFQNRIKLAVPLNQWTEPIRMRFRLFILNTISPCTPLTTHMYAWWECRGKEEISHWFCCVCLLSYRYDTVDAIRVRKAEWYENWFVLNNRMRHT